MGLIRIKHETVYRYSGAVGFGRHRLVLRPREGHDARVEEMKVAVSPKHHLFWTRDVFGNTVGLVDLLAEAAELSIVSTVVLKLSPSGKPPAHVPWAIAFPVVYDALESVVAAAYRATSYPDDAAAVRGFLETHGLLGGKNAEAVLDKLNGVVKKQIKYARRLERGVQTPGETLQLTSGSCRDVATLMMECCRNLGMAARFASGYLDCAAARVAEASTHAWIEAYLPGMGWVGFDGTLGERVSARHIVCGVSNHPRGVMPVTGTYEPSEGVKYLGMTVAVGIGKV